MIYLIIMYNLKPSNLKYFQRYHSEVQIRQKKTFLLFYFIILIFVCLLAPSSCGSPDKLLNTTIEGGNYSVGAAIQYHCPVGHRLVGDGSRTCGQEGFWSGTAPSCNCKQHTYQSLLKSISNADAVSNYCYLL